MVQPTKVLYLAVDGVAPRAKMNQQRSRRFRSAKEAEVTASEIIARSKGGALPDELKDKKRFDSNCITPGTDFLLKLNLALQKWVEFKMETDPFWKGGADVIVSGPDVPGEGEHKVMDFIRETRETVENGGELDRPYWKPNYTHVLYGLDADLIMLGLVTHEPEFLLLREKMSVVMAGRGRSKYKKKKDMLEYTKNDFEILELASLRQMLSIQFRKFADEGQLKVPYEIERVIDDFIFMCMLVGNDFLPHFPSLEIDGGALSLMMSNYVDLLPVWGGYLTKKEAIHPDRLEQFMYNLAVYEEEHFKRRGYEENETGFKLESSEENDDSDFYGKHYSGAATPAAAAAANRKGGVEPAAEEVEIGEATNGNRAYRKMHPTSKSRSYRDFYYESKLDWKPEDRSRTLFRRRTQVRDHLEGLHWNLNYYHNGCQSWDWYFPYFYAPLATDVVNLSEFYDEFDEEGFATFAFEQTEPIPSLAQLLSVLPPQSADLLPKPLAELMLNPASPIVDFYPPDFTVDPNGKRMSWEALVLIPFIDSRLLLDTVNQVIKADDDGKELFTNAERRRNIRGKEHAFIPPGLTEEERVAKANADRNKPARQERPRNDRAPAGRGGGAGRGRGAGRGGRGRGSPAGRGPARRSAPQNQQPRD
jgi:5'-3' exoribonuclease 1